ncbi:MULTISPECIES: DNA-3-methyladenine glycosylase I [Pseudonocardia]|uniref:DNA-3-methyladenine glycosylase 1 n=2 Tax=Pseudonocardia TaxID=1847 RepID=A0A1Y2N4Q1_PSEAH|nr:MULTISPECIES: DNA-3-methyladenine glycosylase I [Pseudonocardia]OSY42435.1 DNA-3-methyladenine glycosylase 1 [Pseudonocardia autotrophica]TDN75955.1 DNA-3-methyladenine glycosylase I [Pseudonocardia autotrophica]BBF99927.1 DNA-3-methyladenine glycosylase I [Pseudonocardia autotrophica]GEC24986.1 DNA-3-methyladenine glycosylase I [Pseudonocardia saturnea]
MTAPDGRGRCDWATSAPDYVAYHDDEWGRPVHGTAAWFERMTLEGFQSGLSWIVILRKRPAFREVFDGFDPERVARFGDDDVARLLTDARIVRNRQKIEATVSNARAVLELTGAGEDLGGFLASFAPDPATRARPATLADVPASTPESTALSRALKKRGFRFVGPTTCYALMQATGLVDDHVAYCWRSGGGAGPARRPG